jgi:endonuclease YncB( thermonuclease family)
MSAHPVALSLLVLLHVAASPLSAATRVLSIVDGDSLWVQDAAGARVEVRLAEIDSPERSQPYGERARRELAGLVARKYVRLEQVDTDRYGRPVVRVYVGALDVNAEMIRRGAAWVYPQYLRDPSFPALEDEARAHRLGLWALPASERVPPWEWRHSHPRDHAPARAKPDSPEPACGAKKRCAEMSSCEEARFYLESCGLSRLDPDHDGVPCESLCR